MFVAGHGNKQGEWFVHQDNVTSLKALPAVTYPSGADALKHYVEAEMRVWTPSMLSRWQSALIYHDMLQSGASEKELAAWMQRFYEGQQTYAEAIRRTQEGVGA